jgi:hypothetical protein
MFHIINLGDNIIDLNGLDNFEGVYEVESLNLDNGKRIPFIVDLVTSPNISVNTLNVSSIRVVIEDASLIGEESYIVLKNLNKEKIVMTIKPDTTKPTDVEYKFKITKSELVKDDVVRIKILSKANGEEASWRCSYQGQPILYYIAPLQSDKSGYVYIKLMSQMVSDYVSTLIFEQLGSLNTVEFKINNTPKGLELLKK